MILSALGFIVSIVIKGCILGAVLAIALPMRFLFSKWFTFIWNKVTGKKSVKIQVPDHLV